MNDRKIIIAVIILIIASFFYLSYKESAIEKHAGRNQGWFLYFNDPKSRDLSFTVENYEEGKEFKWALYLDKDKIQEGSEFISFDSKKSVSPEFNLPETDRMKFTIEVTDGKEDKKINKQ